MPAFPRELTEIKELRTKNRRKKPSDAEGGGLGAIFAKAQKEKIPHAHDLNDPDATKALIDGKRALDEIFKWIRGETSRLLDKINQGIADFNEADSQSKSDAAHKKYDAATEEFTKFVNDLNNPNGTSFGATINAASIEPVQEGGYYTSARVVIQWLGGTHSDSSTLHVP